MFLLNYSLSSATATCTIRAHRCHALNLVFFKYKYNAGHIFQL